MKPRGSSRPARFCLVLKTREILASRAAARAQPPLRAMPHSAAFSHGRTRFRGFRCAQPRLPAGTPPGCWVRADDGDKSAAQHASSPAPTPSSRANPSTRPRNGPLRASARDPQRSRENPSLCPPLRATRHALAFSTGRTLLRGFASLTPGYLLAPLRGVNAQRSSIIRDDAHRLTRALSPSKGPVLALQDTSALTHNQRCAFRVAVHLYPCIPGSRRIHLPHEPP